MNLRIIPTTSSGVATVHVSLNVGMQNCRDAALAKCHLAHVVEHMIAQLASPKFSNPQENNRILAVAGVNSNAFTDSHRTVYTATGPEAGIQLYLKMLAYTLQTRTVDKGITSELKSVRRELENALNEKDRQTHVMFRHKLYGEDPKLLEKSITYVKGLIKNEQKAVRDIKAFIDRHYTVQNLSITIAINKISYKIERNLKRIYQSLKDNDEAYRPPLENLKNINWGPLNNKCKVVIERGMDASTCTLFVAWELRNVNVTDHHALQALGAVRTALTGGLHVRLTHRLRTEQQVVYSVVSDLMITDKNRNSSCLLITTQCSPAHVKLIVNEIHKELKNIKDKKISEDELTQFKNQKVMYLNEHFADQSSANLVLMHSSNVAWSRKTLTLSQRLGLISSLTTKDVARAADMHLGDKMTIVIGCHQSSAKTIKSEMSC